MMDARLLYWARFGVIGLSMCSAFIAEAIVFDAQNSYATITHDPGPNAFGYIMEPVTALYTDHALRQGGFGELTGLKVTADHNWNVNPFLAPTPIPNYTAFLNIPDVTLGGGGVSHYTLPGNFGLNDPAYANYSMAYETGVGQDNGGLSFTGFSKLTVDLHMRWDAKDGWAGANLSAYQFLGMDLVSLAVGDEAKVSAVYDYTLDVYGQANPDTLQLSFSDSAKDAVGVKPVFLFDSGYLRLSNLPPTLMGTHTLTLDATITFEAKDPFRPAYSRLFNPDKQQEVRDFLQEKVDGGSQQFPSVFGQIFSLHGGGVGNYFLPGNLPPRGDGSVTSGVAVSIPEPTSLGLLIIVGVGLLGRRQGGSN